jgi:hypothetical protein
LKAKDINFSKRYTHQEVDEPNQPQEEQTNLDEEQEQQLLEETKNPSIVILDNNHNSDEGFSHSKSRLNRKQIKRSNAQIIKSKDVPPQEDEESEASPILMRSSLALVPRTGPKFHPESPVFTTYAKKFKDSLKIEVDLPII